MENLFDLLIILFIIYAFLAPLLKRKKPPVPSRPPTYDTNSDTETVEKKSSQDILREIELLFGYEPETDSLPDLDTEKYDEEFKPIYEDKSNITQITVPKFEDRIKNSDSALNDKLYEYLMIEPYDYDSTIPEIEIDEFDYSKLDDFAYNKSESIQTLDKTLSVDLENFDNIKKAIIYKEIFDTPIALRVRRIKWQRNIY